MQRAGVTAAGRGAGGLFQRVRRSGAAFFFLLRSFGCDEVTRALLRYRPPNLPLLTSLLASLAREEIKTRFHRNTLSALLAVLTGTEREYYSTFCRRLDETAPGNHETADEIRRRVLRMLS